ncbi:MAG: class I SAM-dependent methyltransferase, partial [Alphaproteobacteria bacterium]|nr:class I SAM-dependent methyltransferase [Alphaproteobacteria bacterium]
MTPQARVQTTIELLDSTIASVQRNGAAADQIIADGFKSRRYAGSRDRRAIRDMIYQVIRAYGSAPVSGRAAVQGLGMEYAAFFDGSPYGPAALTHYDMPALAMPLPEWLSALIPPLEQQALLQRAPLDLRVNTLKTDIETALACFPGAKRIGQRGLRLADNRAIEQSDAWRDGWVDIQDYGSQYIAQVCVAQPGQTVVDLCAGAGGKALALAANMENQGRLIACDIDRARLARLRPRAHRLGAAMIESRLLFAPHEQENLADLHQ